MLVAALAPAAWASTASSSGAKVSYQASPGESNQVEARLDATKSVLTITDRGANITAASGCWTVATTQVACSATPSSLVWIDVADGDDTVNAPDSFDASLSVEVNAGSGHDSVVDGTFATNRWNGGPGNDVLNVGGDSAFTLNGEHGNAL